MNTNMDSYCFVKLVLPTCHVADDKYITTSLLVSLLTLLPVTELFHKYDLAIVVFLIYRMLMLCFVVQYASTSLTFQ